MVFFVPKIIIVLCVLSSSTLTFTQFDDSVLFRLDWPIGENAPDEFLEKYNQRKLGTEEAVVVTSTENEHYMCTLPRSSYGDEFGHDDIAGPSPQSLLEALYKQRSCAYRIEVYWTYELCHGRFLRQFHEEKESVKRVNLQEYYLGQYLPGESDPKSTEYDQKKPPKRKVDQDMLAYYPVTYSQGTKCDITGNPRQAVIMYVCVPDSATQIVSIEEVSSCEYEVLVLTSLLCSNPAFKHSQVPENIIQCYAMNGSPPKPTALTIWEQEQKWDVRRWSRDIILPDGSMPPKRSSIRGDSSADTVEEVEVHLPISTDSEKDSVMQPPPGHAIEDKGLTVAFLEGSHCLYGGAGWWKHEYCHGKQVIQFHEDQKTGKRSEILLGVWNQDTHLRWLENHPEKKPVRIEGEVRQVSHFYSHGDLCEEIGQDRNVEVRLRCRRQAGSPSAVSLYLLEPQTCQYILGVESQLFCQLLQDVDDFGLFSAT